MEEGSGLTFETVQKGSELGIDGLGLSGSEPEQLILVEEEE